MLDRNGDVVIEESKIKMVSDTDLIIQTVRHVLKTNLGEWWMNEKEGIDFRSLLCKNPNYDRIEDNILLGLRQVDDSFRIIKFEHSLNIERKLTIKFTAENDSGEIININL